MIKKPLGHLRKFWNALVIVQINYPFDHLLKTPRVSAAAQLVVLSTSLVSYHTHDRSGPRKHNQAHAALLTVIKGKVSFNYASLHIFQRLTGHGQLQRRLE